MKEYFKEVIKFSESLGINEVFDFVSSRFYNIEYYPSKKSVDLDTKPEHKELHDIQDLQQLNNAIANINCELKRNATNTVFYDGSINSKILLIGEAPGEEEDKLGIPFCGKSGKLLTKALHFINLHRDKNLLITNSVFWRPPDNRKPTNEELKFCQPYLLKLIEIIQPKMIILCGSVALNNIIREQRAISELVGQVIKHDAINVPIFPIYHPSYLLRNPIAKKIMWQNLSTLKRYLVEQELLN